MLNSFIGKNFERTSYRPLFYEITVTFRQIIKASICCLSFSIVYDLTINKHLRPNLGLYGFEYARFDVSNKISDIFIHGPVLSKLFQYMVILICACASD